MGKRQHQKDKMYLTYTEWTTLYGGKKEGPEGPAFRRLPFDHCCVSLQPYENPYCDREGNIYELQPILKYINKYKVNPVTGKPISRKELIKLNIAKDSEGKPHCPVLYKHLMNSSHIAAIATTGNVFSYEAVEQLNIKQKSYKDLLTDDPFTRTDIIILQDPTCLNKFNIANFHHVKNEHRLDDEELEKLKGQEANLKSINKEARAILDELKKEYKAPEVEKKKTPVVDQFNAAHYSTGAVAAGFTSTTMTPETTHQPAIIAEDDVKYDLIKKKGYIRLVTNHGPLNLELHCNIVPKTCENFIKLCEKGYYNGTIFHRSIRHFMVQGGDPTGTGTGGESIWGKPFEDQIFPQLNHVGRGILSMANSGPNTNKSQFFITYRSCRHLDGKHTVFGQVVGGLETLSAIEKIEVDNKDRPIEDIVIVKVQVFTNPFQEVEEMLAEKRAEALKKQEEEKRNIRPTRDLPLKAFKSGVGKYIRPEANGEQTEKGAVGPSATPVPKKRVRSEYEFGSFKGW